MKASSTLRETFRAAIEPLDTPERRERYQRLGLTWKRYRWDLLWESGAGLPLCNKAYAEDLKDDHIDTVLRSIVPKF